MTIDDAVKELGAALESPAEGMAMLSCHGFRFNRIQRLKLRWLMFLGMVKQAQKYILSKISRGQTVDKE
jgi:hypothetical protein